MSDERPKRVILSGACKAESNGSNAIDSMVRQVQQPLHYSRVTEAKRHLLFVTPHIVAGSAFYENLPLSFTINSLQQLYSEALDFYNGRVSRE